MKSFTLAAATALLSTSYAATVTLQTTKCLDNTIPLEKFDIEIGTSKPVAKDLSAVCGLRILSASDSIDVHSIYCQAFKDTEGAQSGSTVFTYDHPALIATNPVKEKSILCSLSSENVIVALDRRQNENSTSSAVSQSLSTVSRTLRSTVFRTSTASVPENSAAGNSTSSAARSTITRTVIASASSGLPTLSGNATVPSNTGRPSATQSSQGPAESTGAAGTIGMGAGVVVAAFAAILL